MSGPTPSLEALQVPKREVRTDEQSTREWARLCEARAREAVSGVKGAEVVEDRIAVRERRGWIGG